MFKLKQVICSVAISLVTSLATSKVAFAEAVRDVHLLSPVFDQSMITARVEGQFTDTCSEVEKVVHDLNPIDPGQAIINIFLEITRTSSECAEATTPFLKDVFLGFLENGALKVNVYENDVFSFSKDLFVPYDLKSNYLGNRLRSQRSDSI